MTIKREVITDENGEPLLDENGRVKVNVIVTPLPGEETAHAVVTGRHARGVITLADGTLYDVTPEVIQVSAQHTHAVGFHIAKKLEADGLLNEVVHGRDYDGPAVTVVGGESAHYVAHVGAEHLPIGGTEQTVDAETTTPAPE